jgi:hypothetical protein
MSRDTLAAEALAQIPKILTLLDRNAHSPTYGCCDRNYWHYKIIDFPSGMAQEFVWPLALAWQTNSEANPYYQSAVLRDWVEAGILFAATSARADGSCDDYFPFERAAGAAAFSLLACLESYDLLGLKNDGALQFFQKRADWLAHHRESGRLTNHHALTVLALERLGRMLNTSRWNDAKDRRLEQILSWQDQEGWFPEYEGFDPGYHTLTVSCLAQMDRLRGEDVPLREALTKAVRLAAEFVHPDGTYGGEYGSRNTYNFFPHGFEVVGRWLPEALAVNDRFLTGLEAGLGPCYADDHIIGHHAWNYLLAWRDYVQVRPTPSPCSPGRIVLRHAGIVVDRRDGADLYVALNKGGVFKFFRDGKPVTSDTQFSVLAEQDGKLRNAVAHLTGDYETTVEKDRIVITGRLGWAKSKLMTPMRLLLLRLVMLTVGRFFADLIRKLLQKMLITGKAEAPFEFRREFQWINGAWRLQDELRAASWESVRQVGIGCDQTSTYTVMSRTFQRSHLARWLDLTDQAKGKPSSEPLKVERVLQ